jgi:hypothetical protein
MTTYSTSDVGGGWVITELSNIGAESCPLDTDSNTTTIIENPVIVGIGIVGFIMGAALVYITKDGGKK